jgi:hypothetical protein
MANPWPNLGTCCRCAPLVVLVLGASIALNDARATVTTLVNNGPPANRVDVVFIGDGYTQANINAGVYDQHIQSYVNSMFGPGTILNDPFDRYAKFFNIHKINVVSAQSGADKPSLGVFVNTALDATYESSGIDRLLTISASKANTIRTQNLAGTGITADMQLAVVNDTKYGGSGGSWAVFAGGNGSAQEIALHELGHSFSNLADEYSDLTGSYTGAEPSEPNATKSASGTKWSRWAGFDDPRGSNLDIGVFTGAKRYPTGVYRPSSNSKMRTLGQAFDAVSRETFILDIYDLVDSLDGWLNNSAPVVDDPLWIDLVDSAVQAVQWYVDGSLIPGATGESFDASAFGFGPGDYSVRARVYDRVLDHVGDGGLLDLVRKDLGHLEQSVSWTLELAPALPGDFNGDSVVDAADLVNWSAKFGLIATGQTIDGDANGDGNVDGADFLVWQQNTNAAAAVGGQRAVPEPASLVAAGLIGGCIAARGRRRRILSR